MSIIGDLFSIPDRAPWTERAACAQVGGDWWHPDKGESPNPAKRICGSCPVSEDCLQHAVDHGERLGIWGGLTAKERLRLMKKPPARLRDLSPRACGSCGRDFQPWTDSASYCSRRCSLEAMNQARREKSRGRTCAMCGHALTVGRRTFCSAECNHRAQRENAPELSRLDLAPKRHTRMCRTCGVQFDANHPRARYCTDECKRLAVNAQMRHRRRGA